MERAREEHLPKGSQTARLTVVTVTTSSDYGRICLLSFIKTLTINSHKDALYHAVSGGVLFTPSYMTRNTRVTYV